MFTEENPLFVSPLNGFCLAVFTDQAFFSSVSPAFYNAYPQMITALSSDLRAGALRDNNAQPISARLEQRDFSPH